MSSLEEQIKICEEKSSVLEPNQEIRTDWFSQIQQFTHQYIDELQDAKAFIKTEAQPVYDFDPETTFSLEETLAELRHNFNDFGLRASSGGHVGYIPGGGIFPAGLGDLLAAVTNEYAGMYFGSPGAVTLENQLLDWVKSLFDFPEEAVGNLTSGGSIANLIALTAARDAKGIKNEKVPNAVVYMTLQVHHCIQKALRIIGLGDVVIRYIPMNDRHQLDIQFLEKQLQLDHDNHLQPFLVIGSAGTTDTGAIDPLEDMAVLSKKFDCWFHVDGAYGGFFYLLENLKPLFKGIEKADSLVVDPHKGLFLPYGLGVVLVKNKDSVFHSHHYTANYMQDAYGDGTINPADVSPELTKHFRGLRLWLPIKLLGIAPFKACLEEKILLTHYFREELVKLGFVVGPEPDLSVSYFYYPKDNLKQQNDFNRSFHLRLIQDGSVFLSSSTIDEKFVIRMAILSFRTKKRTIDRALDMIRSQLKIEN